MLYTQVLETVSEERHAADDQEFIGPPEHNSTDIWEAIDSDRRRVTVNFDFEESSSSPRNYSSDDNGYEFNCDDELRCRIRIK